MPDPAELPTKIEVTLAPAPPPQDLTKRPFSMEEYLKVDLTEDERRNLAREILTSIDQVLTEKKERHEKVEIFRNMYRQLTDTTPWPFAGAYHVNVPITPDKLDTAMSETSQIFEDVPSKWTVRGPDSREQDVQDAVDFHQLVLDTYQDLVVDSHTQPRVFFDAWLLGNGFEARVHKREYLDQVDQKSWTSREAFIADFPDQWQSFPDELAALDRGEEVRRLVQYKQQVINAPVSEHVEWEDAIAPKAANSFQDLIFMSPVGRRLWMPYSRIRRFEQEGDYLPSTAEKLQMIPQEEGQEPRFNPDYNKLPFETFEVAYWIDLPVERDETGFPTKTRLTRCLVNIERKHQLIMRIIRYPYFHNRPYLIPYWIQKTEPGLYQPGLGDKLQELNVGSNALLSHILNAGLVGTAKSFKVRTQTDAVRALKEHEWYPGSYLELSNMDDIDELDNRIPDLGFMVKLFSILLSFADEVTGLSASLSGEADPADPDAPAQKTRLLLGRASKKLRRYINTLRHSVDESGYQSLRLIFQYVPEKQIARLLNKTPEEVKKLREVELPIVTRAAVFDVDRLTRKSEDAFWFKLLLSEPLVQQSPVRRAKLYRMLAETSDSNVSDRIDEILPTDEELEDLENEMGRAQQKQLGAEKLEILKDRVRTRARERGASAEQAEAMAEQAAQRAAIMLRERAQAPAEAPA